MLHLLLCTVLSVYINGQVYPNGDTPTIDRDYKPGWFQNKRHPLQQNPPYIMKKLMESIQVDEDQQKPGFDKGIINQSTGFPKSTILIKRGRTYCSQSLGCIDVVRPASDSVKSNGAKIRFGKEVPQRAQWDEQAKIEEQLAALAPETQKPTGKRSYHYCSPSMGCINLDPPTRAINELKETSAKQVLRYGKRAFLNSLKRQMFKMDTFIYCSKSIGCIDLKHPNRYGVLRINKALGTDLSDMPEETKTQYGKQIWSNDKTGERDSYF
ncbi:uncharacterized protein LOC106161142 isoform X2 [Lingula anatina]|nr:uncharacterized protein LOC106161142 isoform X2 [Lingula anatina]|eukprot:XP_013393462.1 uncharacterized protein LOC106161142 isoform X2 [Lingula anatina]